ncbi:hypothetical protein HQO83_23445 [Rhodococcus fascians]|nr:hypothetical protein [Rhodococcus fascians]
MQLAVHYHYFTLPGGPAATAGLLSDSAALRTTAGAHCARSATAVVGPLAAMAN